MRPDGFVESGGRRTADGRYRRTAAASPTFRLCRPSTPPSAVCTSFGMSISTGPGRPSVATAKASRTASASSSTSSHQDAVLGDRLGDADDVGLLEGVPPDHRARHLAGDRDDRRAVHVRRGEAGHEVGGARTRSRHAHAGAAGRPGVAVRRVRGRLLVPHQHVPQPGVLRERVVERHDRAARVPEQEVRPPPRARVAAEDLGSPSGARSVGDPAPPLALHASAHATPPTGTPSSASSTPAGRRAAPCSARAPVPGRWPRRCRWTRRAR